MRWPVPLTFVLLGCLLALACGSLTHRQQAWAGEPDEEASSSEAAQDKPAETYVPERDDDDSAPAEFTATIIAARMHPALVHFPIAWLILVLLLDCAAFFFGLEEPLKWGPYMLGLTVLSFVPAIVTGLLNFAQMEEPTPLALLHRNLIFAMAAICLVAFLLRLARKNDLQGFLKWCYLGLIFASSALISVAGHIGAKMVFGEEYLPF